MRKASVGKKIRYQRASICLKKLGHGAKSSQSKNRHSSTRPWGDSEGLRSLPRKRAEKNETKREGREKVSAGVHQINFSEGGAQKESNCEGGPVTIEE